MTIDELSIPVRVCERSLIGVGRDRPCSWGNYFWTVINGRSVRVLNMWAENLEAAEHRFLPDGLVKVRHYYSGDDKPQFCLVIDERIPAHWRYDKLCFTGGYRPSVEQARDMYGYLGDSSFEFEQFTDPKSYYAKRGGEWRENGVVSYNLGGRSGR